MPRHDTAWSSISGDVHSAINLSGLHRKVATLCFWRASWEGRIFGPQSQGVDRVTSACDYPRRESIPRCLLPSRFQGLPVRPEAARWLSAPLPGRLGGLLFTSYDDPCRRERQDQGQSLARRVGGEIHCAAEARQPSRRRTVSRTCIGDFAGRGLMPRFLGGPYRHGHRRMSVLARAHQGRGQ